MSVCTCYSLEVIFNFEDYCVLKIPLPNLQTDWYFELILAIFYLFHKCFLFANVSWSVSLYCLNAGKINHKALILVWGYAINYILFYFAYYSGYYFSMFSPLYCVTFYSYMLHPIGLRCHFILWIFNFPISQIKCVFPISNWNSLRKT